MAQIIVRANIVVPNGPQLAFNQTLDVEAYDKIDVTLPSPPDANATDREVDLQPGGTGQVQFIAIISDAYDEKITYKINKKTAPAHKLDQPQMLAGQGAVSLFSDGPPLAAPGSVYLSNGTANPANVQILIGRNATS